MGLTVGTFPSAAGGVVSVAPDGSLVEAQTLMLVNDYWQSPTREETLDWPLDRKIVLAKLVEVREIRNDRMHSNPDPIDPSRLAL